MKAMLEFTLPEDQNDFQCALKGFERKLALERICEYLRRYDKHISLPKTQSALLDKIRTEIFEIISNAED